MTDLLDDLMDSIAAERAAKRLEDAATPQELVSLWWECADGLEGRARKLVQAAYSKRLAKLTGAGAS